MNMNTTRRLDDQLNTVLASIALAVLVGTGLGVSQGDVFGRHHELTAQAAPMQVKAPAPAQAQPVVLAAAGAR